MLLTSVPSQSFLTTNIGQFWPFWTFTSWKTHYTKSRRNKPKWSQFLQTAMESKPASGLCMEYDCCTPDLTPLHLFLQHLFFNRLPIMSPHIFSKYSSASNKTTVCRRTSSKISWTITEPANMHYAVMCYRSLQCQYILWDTANRFLLLTWALKELVCCIAHMKPPLGTTRAFNCGSRVDASIYKFHLTYASKKFHVLESQWKYQGNS